MTVDLERDWLVFVLLGGVIFFFVYVIIHSKMQERKDKGKQK